MKAVGVLALAALAACGPDQDEEDPLLACLPEPYRNQCPTEVGIELFRSCYDGSGSCTWSEISEAGRQGTRFEWANGARYESSFSVASGTAVVGTLTIHAASGERCTLSMLDDTGRCWRYASTQRWYEYCSEVDETGKRFVATHYTCDDGRTATVTREELEQQFAGGGPAATLPMCMQQIESPFANCMDAQGRRYGDRANNASIPNCIGDACGDIASWCSNAMPCDQGLECRNTNADPSVLFGYCTLPCEDQPCPAGTKCILTGNHQNDEVERLCQRTCRAQTDCDPYGRRCNGATADRDGYCL